MNDRGRRILCFIFCDFEFCVANFVAIGLENLMVSVRALVSTCSHDKA